MDIKGATPPYGERNHGSIQHLSTLQIQTQLVLNLGSDSSLLISFTKFLEHCTVPELSIFDRAPEEVSNPTLHSTLLSVLAGC